ncbi:phage tail tape measure protein, lambda family [Arthrobacter sp. yr096]|uniref:peptidoglycan DD-metalloendopeptidase family protein n=1 Tax=Arthrobacter sp. yr096 TaxID=1761750 RepID=UPI0008D7D0C2|nr:peptidoglycan DD-metalloendopeptidase family protein [Arthrobacter sp. yr096]SEI44658.1 phage tail tape measure protein, lambda family [Arthrobacter sp. yr096]
MPVVGIAEVLVKPVFNGVQRMISRNVTPAASRAGRAAGQSMGAGMAAGFNAETANLEAKVAQLGKVTSKAETDLAASKDKLKVASDAESKSLGDLRVAELKLQEVRENSSAKASQIAAAEEKLQALQNRAVAATARRESAERSVARATNEFSEAQHRSSAASTELETHMQRVSSQADETGRRFGRLGVALSNIFRGRSPLAGMADGMRQDSDRVRVDLSRLSRDMQRAGSMGANAFMQSFKVLGGLSAIAPLAGAAGAALLGASGNAVTFAASLSSLAGVSALVPAGLMSITAGAGVLISAFSGVGEALKTAVDASNTLAGPNPRLAAMAVEDAMMAITVAEENAAEAQENAARRVSDAKRNLVDVTLSVAEAQKSAAAAVEMAERDEAKAARDVIQAQKDLVKAREEAAKKVNDVGRALDAANARALASAAEFKKATDLYEAAARNPGTSEAVLAQLQNNVEKAAAANNDAKTSVLQLRDEQAKAQDQANKDNEKVLSAEQKLSDARQAQTDAIQSRKDAQADVLKQEQDGAQRIADAQQAVADATKQAEKSQVDSARAVEQAHRNLERVQMQQADQAAQAGSKSADAMGKLTPAAQEAVRALLVVKDMLGGIRRIAQENFFTGFAAPLLSLANSVMPQLAVGVGAIASALGSGAQIFMRSLESAFDGGVLEALLLGVAKTTSILNTAIDPVVQSFTTLGVVGMDYMPRLGQFVADLAGKFNSFVQGAAADGRLAAWIEGGIQGLKDLWSIAQSVGGIFSALNRAAENAGAVSTLGGLADAMSRISDIMNGTNFQAALTTIFDGANKGGSALLGVLDPLGQAFAVGAPALSRFLELGGQIVALVVGSLAGALSNPAFGAGLTTFLEGVRTGVSGLAPILPTLTTALGDVLTALAPLIAAATPALGEALAIVASGVAELVRFLTPLLTAIVGSPGVILAVAGAFVAWKVAMAGISLFGLIQSLGLLEGQTIRSTIALGAQKVAVMAASAASRVAAAGQWLLNAALSANPISIVVLAIAALVAGLVWFFTQTELGQQIVQNVWGAIQVAVSAVVDWFQSTAMPIIQQVFAVVGGVFTWLYENVIRPVFEGISLVVGAWWAVTSYIFQILQAVIEKIVAPAFVWLYENVIKPVFGFIGALISAWWTTIVKPIFDGAVWLLNNVLGPAFNWLYQVVIKPAFDGIGAAIKWVWENVIKPVFDTLGDFITKTIPKAFEDGVGFIKTAWEKLQEIAKAPVRFVVDTVINDGLINGLNGIGKFLGLPELPRVALPAGFHDGGYTGDGGKYDPAGIVHAGEFVFTKEETRNAGIGNLYALAKKLRGYATGGLVRPIRNATISQPFHSGHNGIDFAAATGTPVFAAGPGRVSSAGWSSYGGGNEIHIDHPNGLQTWYAHLSSFAVKMGQMLTAGTKIGEVGSTGNSTGPHLHYMVLNGGWPSYVNPAAYLDGGGEAGSGGGGWNPIADIVGGLVDQFKKAFPEAGFMADMAIGAGKKLLDGAVDFVTGKGGKDDGIGSTGLPYLHDQGGIINPGLTQVMNRTRKPEALLNPQQWADIHYLATSRGGGRGGVTFTGPVHVRDENEMARIIETRQRDAFAVHS